MTDRVNGLRFFLALVAFGAVLGGIGLAKGGLYVDQHEGDMLHLIDIVMRMSLGEVPHLDFVTPLGIMAFLPFSSLVGYGFSLGSALIWGQILFALAALPMIWWTGYSRLGQWQAYAMGFVTLVLGLAFFYGNTDANVSFSMHYNRWAWCLAVLAVIIGAIRPARSKPLLDGLALGLCMSFFLFGKVTFAVGLAPGLVLALLLTQQWRALAWGICTVGICALVLTLWIGVDLWAAYLSDLLLVSGTDVRPRAGETWYSLLFSPKFVVAHAVLLMAIVYLRQGLEPGLGLILMALAPGFLFITYQNYGNDPKWLLILALLLLQVKSDAKSTILGMAAALLIAPSVVNMAVSPVRHLLQSETPFTPAFAAAPLDDIFTKEVRDLNVSITRNLTFEEPAFTSLNAISDQSDPLTLNGEVLRPCIINSGLIGIMQVISEDLEAQGLAQGQSIFSADTFGSFWLFGDVVRTGGAAPWYYGALSGLDSADYVLVPRCSITARVTRTILNEIKEKGISLREVRRTSLYTLYEMP